MDPLSRLRPPETKPHTSVFRLTRAWYIAALSRDLGRTPQAIGLLGAPLALFRTASGAPAAVLDRCPHRNVPLSGGAVRGEHIACPYHGWEFDREGACRAIPGLIGEASHARGRRVLAYPAREAQGFVWVWGDPESPPDREPFAFPTFSEPGYTTLDRVVDSPGTMHATLENALDVPHTAFLHGGLFRTSSVRNPIDAVVRRFDDRAEVEYLGEPRPSGLVGRLLSPSGGIVTHFDRFFLPCIAQVEYRIGDENHVLVTAGATPVSDFQTRFFARIQFRTRLPGAVLRPVLEPLAMRIFGQDAAILAAQSRTIQAFGGEQFESTPLDLIGPHIYRLLRDAERGRPDPDADAEVTAPPPSLRSGEPGRDVPRFERRVRFEA